MHTTLMFNIYLTGFARTYLLSNGHFLHRNNVKSVFYKAQKTCNSPQRESKGRRKRGER